MSGMVLLGLLFHASYEQRRVAPRLEKTASLVRQYRLTDLSLFTEARYPATLPWQTSTRHSRTIPSHSIIFPQALWYLCRQ